MEMLPPVGWADVATKHDLAALEERMELRFDLAEARWDARMAQFEARFIDALRKQTIRFWTGLALAVGASLGIVEGLGRIS